jgi:hypothetical protein
MDKTTLALFVHELRNQCIYTEAAFRVFNQSLEQNITAGAFFGAQSTLLQASQIASLLWPNRARAKKRGETLREVLKLPEKHPLNDRRLCSIWEHGDEKFEDWVGETKGKQIVFDHLGPIQPFLENGVEDGSVYRLYDPTTQIFHFRGDGYKMQAIADAISDIYTRVTSVHMQMFPDQHQQPESPDAVPLAETKEEKPKAIAKPKSKAKAKAKAPAKKKAAPKKK